MTWIVSFILWSFHSVIGGFYFWVDPYPEPVEPFEMREAVWSLGASGDH